MAGVRPNRITTSSLKSRFLRLADTGVYQVQITPPPEVIRFLSTQNFDYDKAIGGGQDVELKCVEAVLPGTSLATHDVQHDYAGASERMAYRRMYDQSFDCLFMVDYRYDIQTMFEGWIDYISGQSKNTDGFMSPYATTRFNYPYKYKAAAITLTKFEKDMRADYEELVPALTYHFIGAYPRTIISSPLSYLGNDILRYNVRFDFSRYVRKREFYTRKVDEKGEEQFILKSSS